MANVTISVHSGDTVKAEVVGTGAAAFVSLRLGGVTVYPAGLTLASATSARKMAAALVSAADELESQLAEEGAA